MDPNLAAYAAQNQQNQQDQGGLLDVLGKIALGAGALAAGAYGAKRLAQELKTGATVDLSSFNPKNVRRVVAEYIAPQEVVAPSRTAPVTAVQRQQQAIKLTRQARAERPQGVVQTNLDQLVQAVLNDLPDEANKAAANQFLARGKERAGVTGALTKATPSPTEFLNEAVEQVTVKVLDQPGTAQLQGRTFQALPVGRATTEELAAGQRLLEDSELLSLVKQQTAEELSEARSYQSKAQAEYRNFLSAQADEVLASIRSGTDTTKAAAQADFASQYLKTAGYQDEVTMVDQHTNNVIGQIDHFANAVNSAEDQTTGRVKAALQRNEDINLAAAEIAEDQVDAQIARFAQGDPTVASVTQVDAAINQVASSLEDGLPVDQAEKLNTRTQGIDLRTGERFALAPERPYRGGLQPGMQLGTETQTPSKGVEAAQKFLTNERAEISSQLGEQGLPATAGRIERELANRLSGPKAWEYGPEYTQRKQALQLGATYDPNLLESVGTGVKPEGEVIIAGEAVPISSLREPVVMEATAERLQERVAEKKNWLGNIRLQEQQRQIQLGNEIERLAQEDVQLTKDIKSLTSIPKSFGSAQEAQQASSQRVMADIAFEQQGIIDSKIDELQNKLFKSAKRVAGAERSTQEQISNLQVPEKLKTGIEEGQRIYFEQDPVTGAPIPGTQELRSGRYAIETEAKRGGGRQVVEYDPLGQSGQAKDVYGIRVTSESADDPTQRPTKTGPSRRPLTQPVTPQGLRSVDVTRDIMRIEKSAPPEKAKQMVADYLRKLQS
jgi:hypothetical protein